jgi:hypothetical protein
MDRGFPVRFWPSRVFLFPGTEARRFKNRRIYVDNRLEHLLDLKFNIPFFQRGQFPTSVSNGSQEILTPNPWAGHGNAAPFDQRTYLFKGVNLQV